MAGISRVHPADAAKATLMMPGSPMGRAGQAILLQSFAVWITVSFCGIHLP